MENSFPTEMIAVDIKEHGGPEVLKPVNVPLPEVRAGYILIKNEAVGVNRPDVAQRSGNYPVPPDANPIPGLEVAGEVVAVGENAGSWQVGDNITGLAHGGGYAEYTAVHHGHCLPWPVGFDAALSAAIPENYFTVYYNMFTRACLKEGETLLVHGGSSGIGHAAIQLAHAAGCRVITTAGSDEKCHFCLDAGADKAINYKESNWAVEVERFAGNKSIDVVLDMVAGDYVQKNLDLMGRDGRYALIAFLRGAKVEVNLGPILRDRITLCGSTLRPQTSEEKAAIAADLKDHVWPLLNAGTVKPHVHASFPLAKACEAHALMETSAHLGKIILTV